MRPFEYIRPASAASALQQGANPSARYLGGGTNLLDLMKEDVERPTALIDLTQVQSSLISKTPAGGVLLGAGASNTQTANHPLIRQQYPLLTQAILSAASEQIRNMATNGGNLLQRTRCPYFYDAALPCNKRQPGSGCGAIAGFNRMHAIFGWSNACVAVHPSDMCVALAALEATVLVLSPTGQTRRIQFADFHRLPGDQPHIDNLLQPGELITALELPPSQFGRYSHYLKVRDRSSYAFALVSVAAALDIDTHNRIRQARLVLGGVAHKPWRLVEAEQLLVGQPVKPSIFKKAATVAFAQARPLTANAFKVTLGQHALERALEVALEKGAKG